MPNHLLTVKQVADKLQVSASTVRNLLRRDGLPYTRVGRQLRFDDADIDLWLSHRREERYGGRALAECEARKTLEKAGAVAAARPSETDRCFSPPRRRERGEQRP